MRRLSLLVLCLAIACGGGESTTQPTVASLAGTWSLHDINGIPLPFVVSQVGTSKTEVLSDIVTATATATGTYTQVTQLRTTVNGVATLSSESDSGTYTLAGNVVAIRSSDGSTISGTVKGDTFTLAVNGVPLAYRRQ